MDNNTPLLTQMLEEINKLKKSNELLKNKLEIVEKHINKRKLEEEPLILKIKVSKYKLNNKK